MCKIDLLNAVRVSESSEGGVMPEFCSVIQTRRGRFSQKYCDRRRDVDQSICTGIKRTVYNVENSRVSITQEI